MKVALLGLIQSGKSTLFSAISSKAPSPPGSTKIDEAIVPVPDIRLDWLTKLYKPKKTVAATVDCLDLPGFSFLDDSGRSAARRILDKAKTVDMLVLVVRGFKDDAVPPYRSRVDISSDLAELNLELIMADLDLVSTRISNLEKQLLKGSKSKKEDQAELDLQKRLQGVLEEEKPARTAISSEEELAIVRSLGLFTLKPMMVVVNIDEDKIHDEHDFSTLIDESIPVIALSAKLEQELASLDPDSKNEFMADLELKDDAASRFVNSCYEAMGLISFLTVGPDEVRAWPIKGGISALDAAGKIHTDIRRGFIRAETIAYKDLYELGDEKSVKAAGKSRLEGKTYIVQDGDIINFRFNV